MSWDDFPDWYRRRRRRFPFPSFRGDFFNDIDRMVEEMFQELHGSVPKELVREERLPDGRIVLRMRPFV